MSQLIILVLSMIGTSLIYILTPIVSSNLWNLFYIPAFLLGFFLAQTIVYVLLTLLLCAFVNKKKEHYYINNLYLLNIMGLAQYAYGLVLNTHIKKRNMNKLPRKPCLYIYNHTSVMDPVMILLAAHNRGPMTFVAKKESKNMTFFGEYMHAIGTIFLDRESIEDGVRMVKNATNYIVNKNTSIAIAPEGTRSVDGKLLPFHNGTFQVAKEANCPIVLVGIRGGTEFHKKPFFKRKKIELNVLEVLYPEDYDGMSNGEISSHSFEMFEEYLKNA